MKELMLRRRALMMGMTNRINNLFDYNELSFVSASGAAGSIMLSSNSITFKSVDSSSGAIYFYTGNKLELKPNTTYTSKCKVICVNNGSPSLTGAGTMVLSLLVQDAKAWGTTKFYLVDGYTASSKSGKAGTYEIYTKFTTPADLSTYKYIVARLSALTEVTFDNLILVEGDYNKDNFPI